MLHAIGDELLSATENRGDHRTRGDAMRSSHAGHDGCGDCQGSEFTFASRRPRLLADGLEAGLGNGPSSNTSPWRRESFNAVHHGPPSAFPKFVSDTSVYTLRGRDHIRSALLPFPRLKCNSTTEPRLRVTYNSSRATKYKSAKISICIGSDAAKPISHASVLHV